MDKNGARGRAHSIASSILRGIAKTSIIDAALEITDLTPGELAMVKKEVQSIADEHTEQLKVHKAIEQGETPARELITNRESVNPAGDEIAMCVDGERCDVSLKIRGRWTFFIMPTLDDAEKLYEAFMRVKETEAD